jgi:hypothetical protein
MSEQSGPRKGKPFKQVERDGESGWLYEWDNGEFTLFIAPEAFSFDPKRSLRLTGPARAEG